MPFPSCSYEFGHLIARSKWKWYLTRIKPLNAAESKTSEKDSSLGETLQGGSLGQSLLFAAFLTLGVGLLNLSRSDSQVQMLLSIRLFPAK